MNKDTILLTGAAGFIGSHITEAYLHAGYVVVGIDNLSTGTISNMKSFAQHPNFTFYNLDLRNYKALQSIFERHQPTIINHHAAQKSVPHSIADPLEDNELNIITTLHLIQLAGSLHVRKFIAASSGGALSREIMTDDDRSQESDTPTLSSPYAITKFSGEQYLTLFAKHFDFDYIGLRYANVFGPRQVASGDCGVIPIFLQNMLQGKPSKLMTYPDLPRGCVRDYLYVKDAVAFNLMVTARTQPICDVFNIALSQPFYMHDIYEQLLHVFRREEALEVVGPRAGDLRKSILDTTKVRQHFNNWQPQYSLLDGLRDLAQEMVTDES